MSNNEICQKHQPKFGLDYNLADFTGLDIHLGRTPLGILYKSLVMFYTSWVVMTNTHGCASICNRIMFALWIRRSSNYIQIRKTKANFSCDQAALITVQSVCLSVCLSVSYTFFTMFPSSYHHEISRNHYHWQNDVHTKGKGQRSKVKVTEVKTQFSRFRTVTPVWICIRWWNAAQISMSLWRGALLFFKVICQISRSHGTNNTDFDPNWAFPDCNSSLNSPMALKWCTKLGVV